MAKQVNLVPDTEKIDPNQITTLTLSRSQLSKYLHQMHKGNHDQVVIEVILPRPMIPETKESPQIANN